MFERSVAHRSWTVTVALRALRSTETTFMSWRNCGFEVLRLETDWSDWSKFAGTYSKKFKDDPNRPSSPSWKNISNCTVEICAPPAHRHGGSGAKTYPRVARVKLTMSWKILQCCAHFAFSSIFQELFTQKKRNLGLTCSLDFSCTIRLARSPWFSISLHQGILTSCVCIRLPSWNSQDDILLKSNVCKDAVVTDIHYDTSVSFNCWSRETSKVGKMQTP